MKDEKLFREKLHHHTIPVRDGLWDRIEAQLPPKKDRRALPLFWFTLFATTLLSGALMIGMLNNSINETINTHPQYPQKPTFQTEPLVATTTQDEIDQSTSQSLSVDADIRSPLSNSNDSKYDPLDGASIKKNKSGQSTPQPNPTIISGKRNEVVSIGENSTIQNSHNSISASKQAILASGLFYPVSFLPMAEIKLNEESMSTLIDAHARPDPNCYKFGGLGSDYALSADLFAGPGFSPQTFEENGGEPGYAGARKETEHYQYAWSAGARLNLHHRSGLTARLGFTYSQAGDLFDYTDSLATQSTTRIDSFFAADGTFLYTESSQVLILGTLIKKIHNTYRYLDIPLLVGYELPIGRSLLMVNIGPVLNLTSSHEGQILDPMFHPRSISNGDPGAIDVYKTSLGLSIYLGAGIVIPISNHFSGIAEPSFLYRLKPVTVGSYPLNEHRHYAGLNLGIRYHFN